MGFLFKITICPHELLLVGSSQEITSLFVNLNGKVKCGQFKREKKKVGSNKKVLNFKNYLFFKKNQKALLSF